MGIIEVLVEQCRKPQGLLGKAMIKIMDVADVGFTNWVLNKIDLPANKILDIGCGGGKTLYKLSEKYPSSYIYGVDYSQKSIEVAKEKNKEEVKNGRVNILQGDVLELPFKNEMFSYIIAIRTHYFWNDLEKAFMEIRLKLERGGKFIICSEKYKIEYHIKDYNTNELLIKLLKDVGFSKVELVEKQNNICVIAER